MFLVAVPNESTTPCAEIAKILYAVNGYQYINTKMPITVNISNNFKFVLELSMRNVKAEETSLQA